MRASVISLVLASVVLTTASARAQYWQEDPPETDPKRPAAIGMLVMGTAAIATGIGVTVAGTDPRQQCSPITGECVDFRDHAAAAGGVATLTGGATMAGMGLLLTHTSTNSPPYPYRSGAMMTGGMVFTTLGLSMVNGGSAACLYSLFEDDVELLEAGIAMLAGGGLIGLGMPLWLYGSRPPKANEVVVAAMAEATPEDRHVQRSPALFLGGLTITTSGLLFTAATIAIITETDQAARTADYKGAGGAMTLLAGLGSLGFGIPLMIRGAVSVPPVEAYAADTNEERP